MQGAVLHGLGYNLVKERLIRRSYGVMSSPPFVKGEHPDELRYEDESGIARCRGVMEWFACKVVAIPSLFKMFTAGRENGQREDCGAFI